MTAIWICYILTPLLQVIRERVQSKLLIIVSTITILSLDLVLFDAFLYYVFLYALAYYYASFKKHWVIPLLIVELIIFSAVVVFIGYHLRYPMMIRCTTSILLLVLSLVFFTKFEVAKTISIINYLDRKSYYLYLVHLPLILGPFSLLHYTKYLLVNLLIVIFAVLIMSEMLMKLSYVIQKKCSMQLEPNNRFRKNHY